MTKPVSGLLNIDKPKGISSHDVVVRVRKLTGQRKVGHTGTLDPLATGVLLVCVGQATRLIEYLLTSHKQYRATIRFGSTTDTLDSEGEITSQRDISTLTEDQLRQILPDFVGELKQVPPIYSALKKDGQPLYKRVRSGEVVEVEARSVTIYALDWVAWHRPDLVLNVNCSAGTYIRALARDLGEAVGTGAHLAELVRTSNGQWTLKEAVSLEELEYVTQTHDAAWIEYLQSPDRGMTHLPKVVLNEDAATQVKYGRQIEIDSAAFTVQAACQNSTTDVARAYTPDGEFLAILKMVGSNGNIWQPKKVFQT